MFICNFKINGKKIWKTTMIILIILITVLMIFVCSKIFKSTKESTNTNTIQQDNITEITTENYTNFLKACHDNINNYINKNIKIVGYIYKLPDFSSDEFVIARTMIIDDNNQAVVVGILASSTQVSQYDSGCWIEATGCIKKGDYNGEIPVLEVTDIKKSKAPDNEFVYLPTD